MKKAQAAGSTSTTQFLIVPALAQVGRNTYLGLIAGTRHLSLVMRCCNQSPHALQIDRIFTDPILLDARPDNHAIGDLHERADVALIGTAADQQWPIAG